MAFVYEKRIGAPAGSISIAVGNNVYTIDDVSNTTITVTSTAEAADLALEPYLQLQGGGGGPYIPPPVVEDVFLVDGVLSKKSTGGTTTAVYPVLATGTALVGAGQFTVTTTSATVVASAPTARERCIYNNSASTDVWIGRGVTAVVSRGDVIRAGGPPLVIVSYTGALTAIVASGTAACSYTQT